MASKNPKKWITLTGKRIENVDVSPAIRRRLDMALKKIEKKADDK